MSEFKFACPVCGQHITADFKAAGSKLDCPTCFRKIVVPQAPGSTDSKFILSAAEANRPRVSHTNPFPSENRAQLSKGSRQVWISVVVLVATCAAAGGGYFVFRDKLLKGRQQETRTATGSAHESSSGQTVFAPSTNKLPWLLDLDPAAYPAEAASGRIHDRDFAYERATLQGGTLNLRHGRSGTTDLGLSISFFADGPEDLSGKTLTVTTNNARAPRVTLRWKDAGQAMTEVFKGGYALKLEFGEVSAGRIPGKIYVCLPDNAKSCVAGTFNAEIRKPSPPKPH